MLVIRPTCQSLDSNMYILLDWGERAVGSIVQGSCSNVVLIMQLNRKEEKTFNNFL